jgi:hypothetical protein
MIGRLRHTRWGCIALACAVLATATAPQRGVAAEETTLLQRMQSERADLLSFDVYHISDDALLRTAMSLSSLTESPSRPQDYLHIGNGTIVAELRTALDRTVIPANPVCRDASAHLDVRWAVALNFRFRREIIGFNRMHECIELSTGDVFAVRRPFFDFMERRFGFLVERLP